jgi:hypothetical protein
MNEPEARMIDDGGHPPSSRRGRQRSVNVPTPALSKPRQSDPQIGSQSAQPHDRGIREEITGWRVAAVNGGGVIDEGRGINLSATFENGSVQNLLFTHDVAEACIAMLSDLTVEARKLRVPAAVTVSSSTVVSNDAGRSPQAR